MFIRRSGRVRFIDEYRVMRHMLYNCCRDCTADISYQFEERENPEIDGIYGLIGHDGALVNLKVPQVWEVVNKLCVDGYIIGPTRNPENRTLIEIHFTDKGRYYLESTWRSIAATVFINVLLPILLSIATAYITTKLIGP